MAFDTGEGGKIKEKIRCGVVGDSMGTENLYIDIIGITQNKIDKNRKKIDK